MMRKSSIILTGLLLLISALLPLFGQNVLRGVVKDDFDDFVLPYCQIWVSCLDEVVVADMNGEFEIKLQKDSCDVEFKVTSYQVLKRKVIFSDKHRDIKLVIKLKPIAQVLDPANVVSSKYETNLEKSTSSIVVINPKTAENKNITTVDALINTAGGIAVVDNEPQIRGGSGFSSGMGSRVMILLDNVPLLRADAGRPMWSFIPMEDVEQVEILKGAASVVFGSSALTGAINVLTAYPRLKPKTKVVVFAGMYSNPSDEKRTNWNHHNPIKYGVSFLHSRIIKKNFDLVVGGEFFNDQGYIGPEESIEVTRDSNGSTRGKYETRGRLNFATRYRFEKIKGLSVSLNANFMYSENAQSFFWYDSYDNRFRTYKGSLSSFRDFTFYVDPSIKYVGSKGSIHSFRNRITYSNNEEATGAQSARSLLVFDEYQYNKTFSNIGLHLLTGAMNMYTESFGPVFNGVNGSDESVKMSSDNFAFYAQLEQKLLKKKNLTLALGGRWEFYKLYGITIESEQENKPVFRAGVNYQLNRSKTAFRASFGQGYRYPSIGEKYIAISVGRYGFYPNADLVSETSWNTEIGVVQPFMLFDFRGVFDLAFFNQDFKNYIEFCMGPWGTTGSFMDILGFKFLNIGPARINGIDFSFMGQGKISKNITYDLSVSYTYSNPVIKDRNHVYYSYGTNKYSFLTTSSDTTRNVLKYRIEHMAKFDLAFNFFKKFSVGISGNYYSAMKNVDKFFFEYDINNPNLNPLRVSILNAYGDLPFEGYYDFYNQNIKGSFVFDARVSYIVNDITLSLVVKNIFNKEYTLRPMYIEPLRTFTFQIVYNLN